MKVNYYFATFILLAVCTSTAFAQEHDHGEKEQYDPDRSRFYWQLPNRVI
jgi:hypothetical protein